MSGKMSETSQLPTTETPETLPSGIDEIDELGADARAQRSFDPISARSDLDGVPSATKVKAIEKRDLITCFLDQAERFGEDGRLLPMDPDCELLRQKLLASLQAQIAVMQEQLTCQEAETVSAGGDTEQGDAGNRSGWTYKAPWTLSGLFRFPPVSHPIWTRSGTAPTAERTAKTWQYPIPAQWETVFGHDAIRLGLTQTADEEWELALRLPDVVDPSGGDHFTVMVGRYRRETPESAPALVGIPARHEVQAGERKVVDVLSDYTDADEFRIALTPGPFPAAR